MRGFLAGSKEKTFTRDELIQMIDDSLESAEKAMVWIFSNDLSFFFFALSLIRRHVEAGELAYQDLFFSYENKLKDLGTEYLFQLKEEKQRNEIFLSSMCEGVSEALRILNEVLSSRWELLESAEKLLSKLVKQSPSIFLEVWEYFVEQKERLRIIDLQILRAHQELFEVSHEGRTNN